MIPRLVTFDCAETMVRVPANWSMGWFTASCARHIGLDPTDEDAALYQQMYVARLPEFVAVNMSRDPGRQKAFWADLAEDWIKQTNLPQTALGQLHAAAEELGFGPHSILFDLYDDVSPCLDKLDRLGIRAAVVSNWDYSLHRVLRIFGLADRFIVGKASLEEGVEKPNPRLFQIALTEAGFSASDTLHVGDHPVDDIQGAAAAGIRAVRIDRSLQASQRPVISTLLDLPEAFAWID